MSKITVKELMQNALENKYSVGYFESWDLMSTMAVIRAAENMKSPVIIGVCGTYIGEPKREYKESVTLWSAILNKIAEEATVPVATLLNESDDKDMVISAAENGFDMVMYAPIFASEAVPLQELTQIQKEIVEKAHAHGVAVEGEVGELPLYNSATGEYHEGEDTDPEICAQFVKETGIDTVAVAIGNCHLKEDGVVQINYESLKTLSEKISIPLVVHGGTSIAREDLTKMSQMGVAKVNFGTGHKRVVLNTIKKYCEEHDLDKMEPNDVLGRGAEKDIQMKIQDAMIEYVEETIKAMNGQDKAF